MRIVDEAQLVDLLLTRTPADCETLVRLGGDVLILGAGGKIGLSVARCPLTTDRLSAAYQVSD